MPSTIDPKVRAATVALKRSQTRLTTLRRRHLEGDFIAKDKVEAFVLELAADFRQKILNLPLLIREGLPPNFQSLNRMDLEDCVEAICDRWLREFSKVPDLPKPERPGGGYTSRPGPKPRAKSAKIRREAAE